MEKGKINVYEGEKAKEIGNALLVEEEEKEGVEGITAFPGKVKGKVTKIKSINDKDKFTEGDILVTHDGTAELTYFLKNASAIITDQGGMICHAAIVARETKTPCIVGTKNCTKKFEDGDTIEVDADEGVVKKIE